MAEIFVPLPDEVTASLVAVWQARRSAFGGNPGNDLLRYPSEPILAGGWIRDTLVGECPKDVDLFFRSPNAAAELVAWYEGDGRIAASTPNAVTLSGDPKVQLITRPDRTGTPEQILRAFDFRCCQAALWWNPDGWHTLANIMFLSDCAARELVYADPDPGVTDPAQSVVRACNFANREWAVPATTVYSLLEAYRLNPGDAADLLFRCRSAGKKENY